MEIKILGQTFLINPPDDKRKFYMDVISFLNKMMADELSKEDIRSDIRIAVKVAFLLAAENMELKAEKHKGLEVLERIDNIISSIDD